MSQQDKSTLQAAINTQLADNTSGDISAADVRDNLINMTDSLVFNEGTGQTITGGLTVTGGITGSLQGTAATASYFSGTVTSASYAATASVLLGNVVSASYAVTSSYSLTSFVSQKVPVSPTLSPAGVLYPPLGNVSNGNSDLYTNISKYFFDLSKDQLFVTSVSSSFTGSLSGTATTASYIPVAQTLVDANLPLVLINGNSLVKDQYDSITYNPLNNLLTVVANTDFTGPITSLSSISSTGGFTGSLQGTASLSNETIGAGNPSLFPAGGEIQFKGGNGPGSPEGKNTWSSAFLWNPFSNGLTIGDYLTSYVNGSYTLATGYDSIATGDYSVSHGSGSYANGEGSFTHGKLVTAGGDYSHAEGQSSIATGNYSHAEGNSTEAIGQSSHAEGQFTISQGNGSHSEGVSTTSVGPFSHAEGIGTVASGSFQHVGGRYNTQGDTTSLFIIGNGNVDTEARSDAFKVRMSGSIVLPTTQSAAPSWTGTDGEIVPATVGGEYFLYMWMGGAWRSGSFV